MDPFATLGIDRRYDIDLPALEKRHRELSRALHPDRYTDAGTTERRAVLSKAASVNEAWRILRDPVARAEALFTLAGIPVGERSEPKPSPAVLMDAMDLRGDARRGQGEARSRGDRAPCGPGGCAAPRGRGEARRRLCGGDKLEKLVPVLGELRFHRRFLDEVSAIEDALAEAAVLNLG